jgi:hypothetical protein
MTTPKSSRGHVCPHCQARAVVYTSRRLSPLVVEQYAQCSNLACGCQFVVQVGIVRMTMASAMPNKDLNLPLVSRRGNDILVAPRSAVPRKTFAKAFAPGRPDKPVMTVIDGKAVPARY